MNNDNLMSIPWVEKYRPTIFDNIVLDSLNKKIMQNIIKKQSFPNLLFYGPPGTGKTTTIINLVNTYQEKTNSRKKGLVIHLNASDERGIDIIRNQIYQFVNSKTLFETGTKFVILDEVDYMTKNAQQALKYLLQTFSQINNVRFCLICNYISRIDEALQNEFLRLRFNQLPEKEIINFLKIICKNEKLHISENSLKTIQKLYKSDIRSMINFIQSNHHHIQHYAIIDNKIWEDLTKLFINNKDKSVILDFLNNIIKKYNIESKNIIKDYCNYIIRYRGDLISKELLDSIEFILHTSDINTKYIINYSILRFKSLFKSLQ
jgi:DNA polymerase III delta prime subunit